jgi:ketosteroid isomerase-like protein
VRQGNLAVEIGIAEVRRLGPNGQEVTSAGSYVTVWRRQEDGSWKIHRNLVLP